MPPIPPLDPMSTFAGLDERLPLALLPVRLETRFFLAHDPPELRVRVFPDAIHADGHRDALTRSEQEAGRAFWRRTWRAAGDTAGRDAAFTWLCGRLGPWRAAWVATALRPTNAEHPGQEPRFPPVELLGAGAPTWARLLPVRFAAVLYAREQTYGPYWSAPVREEIALAPGAADTGDGLDGRAWLSAQGLAWAHEFGEAESAGLGIRIDLSAFTAQERREGFEELVVFGVRAGDQHEQVRDLLRAHRYTSGLDFIPQGTPTNTTETSGPGMSLDAPDLAALRAAELDARPSTGRPRVTEDGDLYRRLAADAASIALGLDGANPLDRSANALLADLPHALAMNRALWPALAGHYLDHVLEGVLGDGDRSWLREWSVHFARGGCLLPTLLVGAQPYGLLPVSRVDRAETGQAPMIERVERLLADARSSWDFGAVPRLDPDASDVAEDGTVAAGDLAALASQVMAAVPHPTALHLQPVEAMREHYQDAWSARLLLLGLACGMYPTSTTGQPYPDYHDSELWPLLEDLQDGLGAATGPVGQVIALQTFVNALRSGGGTETQRAYRETWADFADDSLRSLVNEQAARADPLLRLLAADSAVTGKMGEDDEPNAFFTLHPEGTARDWTLPLVSPGRTEDDLAELRRWLGELAAEAPGRFGVPVDHTVPRPLLRTLLRRSIEQAADPGDQAVVLAGLQALSALAATAGDPVGELERLLRETLGVHGYRLDAWYSAVAAWRLENKRTATPVGVQVGAYGFVEGVKPRAAARASQGYVLAPSLTHATTAAVLRSGWAAFGGQGRSGALAVDLSSDRMRRARWLADGVRQGQDLGRLLGARLERGLHDATPGLDHRTDELRSLALAAAGDQSPPTAIVDGLLLARARLAPEDMSEAEEAAAAALTTLLAGAGSERPGLEAVLDSLAADLDAVADAAVAQTVFSLAQGNVAESAAALTAAGSGDATFPALRIADTPRPALTVTHRLLAFLDPGAGSGWPVAVAGGRALAAPALDAWLARLLGSPSGYRFAVRFTHPDTGERVPGVVRATLADVGLAAIDAVFLAPVGEQTGLGRLEAVLAAWGEGRRPAGVPAAAVAVVEPGTGEGSLADLAVVARTLRRLVAEARDLDGRDLAAPGTTEVPAGVHVAELDARVKAVRTALEAHRAGLAAALPAAAGEPARGDVRAALLRFGGFELPAAVPAPGSAADDLVAQGGAVLTAVDTRLTALDARITDEAAGWDALDEVGRTAALTGRLHLLVGHALPVAPHFTPADSAALDATFARRRLAGREAATGWLAAAGRVDPGARRLRIAVDLTEAARNAVVFGFSLGQLPDHEGEGWAALERPAGDARGRLCLLATGTRPPSFAGPVAGLVVSTWTEAVPRRGQDAALAVHFDAPSARAPQAILLCAAGPAGGFEFEVVRDMVKQTFDLARRRMVGPETLSGLGQFLPAAYLAADTAPVES
ncbi:hypothetical protein ACRYCC_22395 [Actinomadura scrupuli]|uniref:hypothetical protein n=1 Tax=Actinomadura scrupuli TaxID=559629 RepID=UPI003D98A8D0